MGVNEARPGAAAGDGDDCDRDVHVDPYRQRAFEIAYRLTGSAHDALSIVQEAFLRLGEESPGLPGSAALRRRLYRMTKELYLEGQTRGAAG